MGLIKDVEDFLGGKGAPAPVAAPAAEPVVAALPPASSSLPRGVRNNNPGNIDRDGTQWQGLAVDQSSDARFCVFVDAEHGIRALIEILLTYQTVHGLKTIAAMINRWAPPEENNTEAYVAAVSGRTGINADTMIDMHDPNICRPITEAIIAQENANYRYQDGVMIAGMTLAGIG